MSPYPESFCDLDKQTDAHVDFLSSRIDMLSSKVDKLMQFMQTISDKMEKDRPEPDGKLYYYDKNIKKSVLISAIYIDKCDEDKCDEDKCKQALNEISGKWFQGQDSLRSNGLWLEVAKK